MNNFYLLRDSFLCSCDKLVSQHIQISLNKKFRTIWLTEAEKDLHVKKTGTNRLTS